MMTKPLTTFMLIVLGLSGVFYMLGGWPCVAICWLLIITGSATVFSLIDWSEVQATAAPLTDRLDSEHDTDDAGGGGEVGGGAGCDCCCCNPVSSVTRLDSSIPASSMRISSLSATLYDHHGQLVPPAGMVRVRLIGVVD